MKTNLIGSNEASILNIFDNRGVNPDSIFGLSDKNLHDPFLLGNMKEAVETVNKAITEGTGIIAIQQDPDADGYSATMAIYDYLIKCYPGLISRLVVLIQPEKAHGIALEQLEEAVSQHGEISLIIAPDCSSNEPEVHTLIKEKYNVDIVVLDHHDAESYSADAVVVNPSLDEYPNKNISGVAVVQKFCHAYDVTYNFDFSNLYFDLVAIGMIGDMIEINTLETIYMVQQGMRNINHPFLKALYKKQSYSLGSELTPIGISFYIAPLINAVPRVATMEEKQLITRAMMCPTEEKVQSTKRGEKDNPDKTEVIQEQAVRIMANIKSRQGRQVDKAMEVLEKQIVEGDLTKHQVIVLDTEGEFPSTFTGLIANKFLRTYNKPVIVGKERVTDDSRVVFAGSVRGDDKSELAELKTFINASGLVDFAEGHEAAHGIQVPLHNKEKLIEHFDTELEGMVFEPVHKLDFDLDVKDVPKQRLEEITRFSTFWARGLEEPLFCLRNLKVNKRDVEVTGSFNSHILKFKANGIDFIAFRQKTEDVKPFIDNEQTTVDIIGNVGMNTFGGETTMQIKMQDFEIQKAQKYFF